MNRTFLGICRKLIFANKSKTILSILAVTLAVALIVSMLSLTNQMEKAFQLELREIYGDADIFVGYDTGTKLITSQQEARVRELDGIENVSGIVIASNHVTLQDISGGKIYKNNVYAVGADNSQLAKSRYKFTQDLGENEVIINYSLAEALGATILDEVYILLSGQELIKNKIVEIIPDPKGAIIPDIAIFNLHTLQRWVNIEGESTYLLVETSSNVNEFNIANGLRGIDDKFRIEIIQLSEGVVRNTQHIQNIGYGLGILAIIISSLLIISNLRIFVYELQKELAMFRAIGGSISQTYQLILLQAGYILAIGGILGLVLGIISTTLLTTSFGKFFGVNMNQMPISLVYPIGISIGTILIIVLTNLFPIYRSAKIPPIKVMQENEGIEFKHSSIRKRISVGFIIVGGGLILLSGLTIIGGSGDGFFGGIFIVIGLFLGLSNYIKIILTLLLPPAKFILGSEVYVSIKNMIPQVKQNSLIVLALAGSVMIAVTGTSIMESIKETSLKNIQQEYATDFVLSSRLNLESKLQLDFSKKVEEIGGVKRAISFARDTGGSIALVKNGLEYPLNEQLRYIVTDLEALTISGLVSPLGENFSEMVIINKAYAKHLNLNIGDKIRVVNVNSKNEGSILTVGAILDYLPGYWYNAALVDIKNTTIHERDIILGKVLIDVEDGLEAEVVMGLNELKGYYPEIRWSALNDAIEETTLLVKQRFMVINIVVITSSIIGLLGMLITLRSQIEEKRKEYALLRTLSLTPKQLLKVILVQSFIYSVIGIVLGSISGLIVAWGFLWGDGGTIIFPWKVIIVLSAIMVVFGTVFTIPIAKRISRRSIIEELMDSTY